MSDSNVVRLPVSPLDRVLGQLEARYGGEPAPEIHEFETVSASALAAPLPDVPYLVDALAVGPGAPVLVAGFGFGGKTLSMQSLLLSVASGRPAWGVWQVKQGRALHLDWEQGHRVTAQRYQRLARGMGVELADLEGKLDAVIHPRVQLDGPEALVESTYARLFEGRAVVLVDSLRAAAPGLDENSSEIRRPLDLLNRIAEKTGTTVIVIHHARKPTQESSSPRYTIRGSGGLYDACGSVFVLGAEKGQPTRVSHEKDRNRGRTVEDFGLRFEDADMGRALRVVHLDLPQYLAALPPKPGKQRFGG